MGQKRRVGRHDDDDRSLPVAELSALDDRGRSLVAWVDQPVNEGGTNTRARIEVSNGFRKPKLLERYPDLRIVSGAGVLARFVDGKPLIASSQTMWQRAVRIAEETLDGKLWLPEVGKSTHYHADYVRPWWARTMTKHAKIGLHIFFRPRMWGDGAEKPSWGDASYTTEAAAKL